ncbi:MAG: DUF5054 domain-containing protein [Oscillospiraceae bacterium]
MKKLIVVSKTHLDLGFTDYAKNIKEKYLNEFIPDAIKIAKSLNTNEKKSFVWTTGSWLIKEAIKGSSEENKKMLIEALKKGDIAPHAMPFTTHTELLDADTLDYGLSIVDEIDKITGRKTIAAKMTDVPGHTIGLVPLLAKHGIKLLHIGVNGASAVPKVPPCFVWKNGDSEIIVIYSGDYGGVFECDYIDDILYFDHTLDNHGAKDPASVGKKVEKIRAKYQDYDVVAGRIDDYAELLWKVKEKLPVLTDEIGDSWIHGSSSDPYKSAALRALIDLKNKWLNDNTLVKDSEEYVNFTDNLLCVAEHTCGMDMKCFFADYENYLRKDFDRARKKDEVQMKHIFRDFPQNLLTFFSRTFGGYKKGSYSAIEKSWQEQREYINCAVLALSNSHKVEAEKELSKLIPNKLVSEIGEAIEIGKTYEFSSQKFAVNEFGGISFYSIDNNIIVENNNNPSLIYRSYGKSDYDFWLKNYTRDIEKTMSWAVGDFARPLLKYADKKYKQGSFPYKVKSGKINENQIVLTLSIDDYCYKNLGSAKTAQIIYTFYDNKLVVEIIWIDKPANRLTESTTLCFYPKIDDNSLVFTKIETEINPLKVVEDGNRNLSAVRNIKFNSNGEKVKITNHHSPLVALGEGKILKFDNKFEDVQKSGISYILHNNVWGTNFPIWYEDNAYFKFTIEKE